MKEIGGYLEFNTYSGEEYHKNAVAVNSGRHALEYLIKAKQIKKIYLPYFLCDSVKNHCYLCGCEYELYHINENFMPDMEKSVNEQEAMYVVNYYGQLSNENVEYLKEKYKNIIVDNAQAFFNEPVDSIDTVYTCRKWFGVCDGGYAYTESMYDKKLEVDVSYKRMGYIFGRFEECAEKFYTESSDNNKFFAHQKLKAMSKLTHNILKSINYKEVINKRNENFSYLHNELKKINRLSLKMHDGPFMYPLYVKNGEEKKKELIKNKIYVPTFWKDVLNNAGYNSLEEEYVKNIVPLPIDQRYGAEDMKYILEVLNV